MARNTGTLKGRHIKRYPGHHFFTPKPCSVPMQDKMILLSFVSYSSFFLFIQRAIVSACASVKMYGAPSWIFFVALAHLRGLRLSVTRRKVNAAETLGTAEETFQTDGETFQTDEEIFLNAEETWIPLRSALEFSLN
ncbi:hypothetical protein MAR_025774 [Mya arenaria]|uniref:Uncharacterized protein n=1 Tax=Mya arenaria TaxID=6604 RepID=A0ABY7ER33_MYAAR|nr:hypothetical protein MAR_025774 [Mya arenaria]